MNRAPMLDNIFGQPASHGRVIKLQQGEQHANMVECAKHIQACEGGVIFSGMGASLFAALPAVCRMAQHGYRVQALESSELLHYGSAALRRGDVGVLISRSGESVEVLGLAAKMRAAGMTVIGVTNVPGTTLERAADLCLRIGADRDQLIAVQTYTGTVLTLLLLADNIFAGEHARLGNDCLDALPMLGNFIEQSFQASESWREWVDGAGPLYLLGRGPALASVYEGALLIHETAKAPAVGMSSAQFRHGPVEVVSDACRVVIFGAPEITRTMDCALARDLASMGAKVCWIGPESKLDGVRELAWPPLGPDSDALSILAPLFEMIPLQLAAYRLALWRGITPGDFRFASEITSEESGFPLFQAKLARA